MEFCELISPLISPLASVIEGADTLLVDNEGKSVIEYSKRQTNHRITKKLELQTETAKVEKEVL